MTFILTHSERSRKHIVATKEDVHLHKVRRTVMIKRMQSYISFENEALFVAALAFLFCGAVILGFM